MKNDARRKVLRNIPQNTHLWSASVLQNQFQPAVVIKIGERERTAVFNEVEPYRGRYIREGAIPIVGIENVPFIAAPGAVGADQFVDCSPALFVFAR